MKTEQSEPSLDPKTANFSLSRDAMDKLGETAALDVRALQASICGALEAVEARHQTASGRKPARFRYDEWQRSGGGGGTSAVLSEGAVFEKAGVNISVVHGQFPADFAATMPGDGLDFYATGVSLVGTTAAAALSRSPSAAMYWRSVSTSPLAIGSPPSGIASPAMPLAPVTLAIR